MSILAIVSMFICNGFVIGGFIYFVRLAMKSETQKASQMSEESAEL